MRTPTYWIAVGLFAIVGALIALIFAVVFVGAYFTNTIADHVLIVVWH